jgi:tetratricopeptide (TPR) repeat protein
MLAYEEAAQWYREGLTAVGWTGDDQPDRRAELLLGLGEALKRAGATAEAKAPFDEAAAIGRATGSAELLTRAALGYAPPVSYAAHPAPDPILLGLLEEAIAAWDGRDASLHARALARLGHSLMFGDAERREGALSAAEAMARRLGDEPALRLAIVAILQSFQVHDDPDRRLALSAELIRLSDRARDLETLAVGRIWHSAHLMEHGDAVAADAEITAVSRLAAELRQPVWQWYAGLLRTMPALRDGRFADAERAARDALEVGQVALPYAARGSFVSQMLVIRTLQGDPQDFAGEFRSVFERHPDPVSISPLAWAECVAGRLDEARKIVDRLASANFAAVRHNFLWMISAGLLAEACAVLEDAVRAAPLYELLQPYAPYWLHWAGAVSLGPAEHHLGLLAGTMGRDGEAAAHFQHAIAETRRVGARPFLARSLYEYAVLLRRPDHRSDAPRSAALLAESRAIAEEIGMAGLLRKIAALDAPAPRRVAASPPEEGVFHREGDYWTIGYAERTVQVRDGRGLQYLARLLHQPGQEMPATFLTAGDSGNVRHVAHAGETIAARDLGDAGPVLDARAAAEYRRRAEELRTELAEAEACNDLGHAARARREIDLLCGELTALHRDRRAASHAERARLTVTKGIKAALAKLADVHPALADHLMATVKRGYLCVYRPDPRRSIRWRE